MEIDISSFFNDADHFEFSASIAKRGQNAGEETWANAKAEATQTPLLTTTEQLDAWRDDMKGFGAWDDEEIDGWSATECNALFIQFVSGDIREIESTCADDNGEIDWSKYRRQAESGRIGGRISHCEDGRIYWQLN